MSGFSYVPIAGTRAPLLPAPGYSPIAGTRAPLLPKKASAPTRPKAPPKSFLSGLPSLLTDAQARDQVMALLAPIFQQQQGAINQAYDQRSASVKAAYDQLARYSQGVAPAVQGAYQSAAKDTAAFGKGFSDAVSQASQGQASAATAGLAAQGGPQTVTSGLANGGADALYAMGGAIPGSTLEQQGAAFGSAASFLPRTAAGYGAQAVNDLEQQRVQDIQQLVADQPQTVLSQIGQLLDRNYSRRQDALKLALDQRDYRDTKQAATAKSRQDMVDRQWEAATLKQAYGYKLTPREKKLLNTYGTTPSAVEAQGRAKLAAQDDARSRAASDARDRATAARQAAHDAATATAQAKAAASRSGLEADKAKYRAALEKQKQANRRALEAQKQAGRLKVIAAKPAKKKKAKGATATTGDNPADRYYGG